MRIAYLVLAHDNPAHLERLLARLGARDACIYVHIDRKSDLDSFAGCAGLPGVRICPVRVDCAWGNITLVDATLALAKMALAGPASDYFVLLSGACYPIHSPHYIERFFERNRGLEFIEAFPFPNVQYGKPIERISRYYIKRGRPLTRLKWKIQDFMHARLPARNYRKALDGLDLATGSQWWALTGLALGHVVDQIDRDPQFYRFCRHVDCPDEFVFQTILWNSPFRAKIDHSLTYTRWAPASMGPAMIDAADMARSRAPTVLDAEENNCPNPKREVLWARKFTDQSGDLLREIDAAIPGRETAIGEGGVHRA